MIFTINLYHSNGKSSDFYAEAGNVCSGIISEYGSCKLESSSIAPDDQKWSLTGICHIQNMDFDADGNDELLVSYSSSGKYIAEVWGFSGSKFTNIYKAEANSLADYPNLGSWITVYHRGGKYYLTVMKENSAEEADILALTKKGFTAVSSCTFNPANETYSIDGEANAADFETFKFSSLPAARAEFIQSNVSRAASDFIGENNNSIANSLETDEAKRAHAFVKVIEAKYQKYGKSTASTSGDSVFADGAAIIRLIDFNGDGIEELLVVSRNKKHFDDTDVTPKYIVEVFSWYENTVRKIFEESSASSYYGNEKRDVFFILQKKNGIVNICTNTYSYGNNPDRTWRGISTISEMTSPASFETTFTAVSNKNNGYTTCRINGKSVSLSEFNKNGCIVPYFCNDDKYSTNEFEITLLKGGAESKAAIEKAVSDSQETVSKLRGVYETDNK